MLRRQLTTVQWFALFLLFVGISLVQVENMTATAPKQDVNAVYGFLAVIVACKKKIFEKYQEEKFMFFVCLTCLLGIFSGLAGVYFEKILKTTNVSVWIRNIQLGVFGIFFGILTMLASDGAEVRDKGFFVGYTKMVWTATIVHSVGGLIVALVVKHADNILKGFATSSAIVLSCIVSIILFDFQLTLLFTLGSGLVIFSIFLYSVPELITHIPILNMFFRDKSVLP